MDQVRSPEVLARAEFNGVGWSMSNKEKPKAPPLECTVCGAQMRHLANLQLTVAFPASRVYRCYTCDLVVQQVW